MSGCLAVTPPSEDPVLIKLEDLDRRLQAIERVVQNQSLVTMTQQLSALERRVDELQGGAEERPMSGSENFTPTSTPASRASRVRCRHVERSA
jgi:hypothetical protein